MAFYQSLEIGPKLVPLSLKVTIISIMGLLSAAGIRFQEPVLEFQAA